MGGFPMSVLRGATRVPNRTRGPLIASSPRTNDLEPVAESATLIIDAPLRVCQSCARTGTRSAGNHCAKRTRAKRLGLSPGPGLEAMMVRAGGPSPICRGPRN